MTPMERQIQGLLDSHRGCLLVMEVGYKYRVFGPGAENAAKALGLVAWRDKHFMTCSFPTGRLAVHVRRLVRAGFRVAVARQTDTAALKAAGATASGKSGTFDRAVDRVFSASTLIFDDVEDELGGGGDDSEGDDAAAAAARRAVLTGPNAGGKSSIARAVALAHVFAQAGGPVPCERADMPLRDAIFTRMGAADDLAAGASTFLAELRRAALPLNEATAASFVILDELGRGTSTHDGVAVAAATLAHLVDEVRATTLFITHYHDLAKAARRPRWSATSVAYARVGELRGAK
ncbi:hypothetical protein JL720_3507 [Aureococcus anophagefferens]|nr:hypothetical protein JL720_3507 [Aureococcus anophagefferens]